MNRRAFIGGALATGLVASVGTALYSRRIEPHDLDVSRVHLDLGLGRPLRVALLGDIHFDPLFEEAYLHRVVDAVTNLNADLIFYTGDFVTHNADRMDDLADILGRTSARLGSYAVLGNHDYWADPYRVTTILEKKGIRVLRNESEKVHEVADLYVTGLDSFWAGNPDLKILGRTEASAKHLMLVHEPDGFAYFNDPRLKLQMSGHTHGGQVRVPVLGAVVLPAWGKLYSEGLFTRGESKLYVNRGIGTLRPHFRLDCPPELTCLDLS